MTNEVEIILSHRENLIAHYGRANSAKIEKAMVVLRDSMASSGIESRILWAESIEPGELRSLIVEVEKEYTPLPINLLIIGGDRIIPFFRLKNEVEDGDAHILSDAPYASKLDEWTLPDRAVGRIPGSTEVDSLLRVLANTAKKHLDSPSRQKNGFGYSTSKWKAASKAVYRAIDLKERLRLSPPITQNDFRSKWLRKKSFLYFNLHGVKEKNEWYGERAPRYPGDYPFFPVALVPDLIPKLTGSVVFSEACYGGYIIDKSVNASLALKFLDQNADCFVGSSATAYGPYEPPSTEADLLCKYFFQYVVRGVNYGNALLNAKKDFVKKMLRVQGYLDEDDTKTLLEFNLLGDPGLRWRSHGG